MNSQSPDVSVVDILYSKNNLQTPTKKDYYKIIAELAPHSPKKPSGKISPMPSPNASRHQPFEQYKEEKKEGNLLLIYNKDDCTFTPCDLNARNILDAISFTGTYVEVTIGNERKITLIEGCLLGLDEHFIKHVKFNQHNQLHGICTMPDNTQRYFIHGVPSKIPDTLVNNNNLTLIPARISVDTSPPNKTTSNLQTSTHKPKTPSPEGKYIVDKKDTKQNVGSLKSDGVRPPSKGNQGRCCTIF